MEHIVARADIFKFVTLRGCDAYQVCLIFKINTGDRKVTPLDDFHKISIVFGYADAADRTDGSANLYRV